MDKIKKTGVELIAEERKRQIHVEGFDKNNDSKYESHELLSAASCYLNYVAYGDDWLAESWPWDILWWKPSESNVRNLVKAGALIAAEIDRLQDVSDKP